MNQVKAREMAKRFVDAGIPAIADNMGGWSGQPKSQQWGIRLAVAEHIWLIHPSEIVTEFTPLVTESDPREPADQIPNPSDERFTWYSRRNHTAPWQVLSHERGNLAHDQAEAARLNAGLGWAKYKVEARQETGTE